MDLVKTFEQNKNIRIIMKNNEPYFAAADVCDALEISNSRQAITYLDKDDVISSDTIDNLGKKQTMNFINEGGLYQLIFRSRKESAKNFKKWVTHEVLPSIRKTGKYSIPEKLKKESTKSRNTLTDEWKKHGIEKPHHFINLTLNEYKALKFDKDKRKKDFDYHELLLLNALESMEALKLFSSDIDGYEECSISLLNTAKNIKEITNNSKEVK